MLPSAVPVRACSFSLVLLVSATSGCEDKPKAGGSTQSSGSETAAERVKRRADEIHSDVQREVKPAATWVDEKSRQAVDGVKKAVRGDHDHDHDHGG